MIALADCGGTLFITSGLKLAIKPAQGLAVDFGVSTQCSYWVFIEKLPQPAGVIHPLHCRHGALQYLGHQGILFFV